MTAKFLNEYGEESLLLCNVKMYFYSARVILSHYNTMPYFVKDYLTFTRLNYLHAMVTHTRTQKNELQCNKEKQFLIYIV